MDAEAKKYKQARKESLTDFKSRASYFWYYYKTHTIIGIIALIVIIFSIISAANRKNTIYYMCFTGDYINVTQKEEFNKKLDSLFVKNPKKEETLVDFLQFNPQKPDAQSEAVLSKISACTISGELDVLLMDKHLFTSQLQHGFYKNLEELSVYKDLEKSGVKFIKGKVNDVDTNDKVYGIDVSDNKFLKDLGYDTKDKVLGVTVKSKNKDKNEQLLKLLFIDNK